MSMIPVEVPIFWELCATQHTEWSTRLGTLKLAILARDNLEADNLLKLKLSRADLLHPTLPKYEHHFECET